MTTLLQQFLRAADGLSVDQKLGNLVTKYSLAIKPHGKYGNLYQFKYDQIESPMHEPLVKECRGIILDSTDDWAVVARPFDKFWNLGDYYADPVDWTKAVMTEKLDGSLIIMYHYDGTWQVATSGTPDASGVVNGFGFSFAELFWKTFAEMGMSTEDLEFAYDPYYTFMFELMTPYNRVVVPHKTCAIKLIGIRNRITGKELPTVAGPMHWPRVKSIPVLSDKEVVDTFIGMEALDQEGWVVVDDQFNRVKVKHPQYVVLHHMRGNGNPTPKSALEVILAGEHEEVLGYWPEWRPLFEEVSSRMKYLGGQLTEQYLAIQNIESQKAFALEAVKTACSGAMFSVRAKKTEDMFSYLGSMRLENLMALLRLDDIPPSIILPTAV